MHSVETTQDHSAPDVDVWLIALDSTQQTFEQDSRLLEPQERARAARFLRPEHQWQWARSRAAMRSVIANYLQIAPTKLRFQTGRNGKPELSIIHDEPSLQFNLSHSGVFALLAVGRLQPLGVDIEKLRPLPDMMSIARRFYSAAEVAWLSSLAEARRHAAFFECWTRKEAVLKASSEGIGDHLRELTVTFGTEARPEVLEYRGSKAAARQWSIANLPCPAGYAGALVIKHQRLGAVRRLEFSFEALAGV